MLQSRKGCFFSWLLRGKCRNPSWHSLRVFIGFVKIHPQPRLQSGTELHSFDSSSIPGRYIKMASRRSQILPFIVFLSSIVGFVTALPSDPSFRSPKLSARLESQRLETTNAANLQKHIEVYGIPYGVLGVVSHGLTFYVIICHFFGRRPLFPWRFLEKEKWNLATVTVSSLVSIILSSVTLARTRGSRPLMILAGMQIVLGAIIDFIHIHRVALKAEGWSKSLSLWAIPLVIVSVFSIYAFYQFPCEFKSSLSLL